MARQCPVCGLFSPPRAQRCDCGWDFATRRVEASYANPRDQAIAADRGMTLAQIGAKNMRLGTRLIVGSSVGIIIGGAIAVRLEVTSPLLLYAFYGALANIAGGITLVFRGFKQRARR